MCFEIILPLVEVASLSSWSRVAPLLVFYNSISNKDFSFTLCFQQSIFVIRGGSFVVVSLYIADCIVRLCFYVNAFPALTTFSSGCWPITPSPQCTGTVRSHRSLGDASPERSGTTNLGGNAATRDACCEVRPRRSGAEFLEFLELRIE